MNGWNESLLTYGLTMLISFSIACIIQLIVVLLEKFSEKRKGQHS